ncbi:MAG: hypothetical protein ACI4B3_11580 [Prevotella sp.]
MNEPNFFVTFAGKLTIYIVFIMKQAGIFMLIVGVLTLAVTVMVEWADTNSTRLVGLVLVIAGALMQILSTKRESKY